MAEIMLSCQTLQRRLGMFWKPVSLLLFLFFTYLVWSGPLVAEVLPHVSHTAVKGMVFRNFSLGYRVR